MTDNINHPPHYTQGGIECIDAIKAMLGKDGFVAFLRGQILKYNWRVLHKNGREDIEKLGWYQQRLLKELE